MWVIIMTIGYPYKWTIRTLAIQAGVYCMRQ